MKYLCNEKDETTALAKKIAEEKHRILVLSGNLGTGKTFFTKAYGKALGILSEISSPTFSIVKEYREDILFYHLDLYRVEAEEELYEIDFFSYLEEGDYIVIEWPEIAEEFLKEALHLRFTLSEAGRYIEVIE